MGGGSIAVAGPLLLALKRRFPDAALVLVCTPQVAVHASLLGLFDRIDVVGDGGFLRLGFSLLGTLLRCRRMRAELLVNLEVYSRVSVFCAMVAGGGFRTGFHLPEERSVRRCYDCSLPFPRSAPVFERYKRWPRLWAGCCRFRGNCGAGSRSCCRRGSRNGSCWWSPPSAVN